MNNDSARLWNQMLWRMRALGKISWLRRVVKCWFSLLYRPGRHIIIKRGPLKGCVWECSRGQQYWMPLGAYEVETANWIVGQLRAGSVFVDVGANAGYFTLLAAKLVGDNGHVYSFEPDKVLASMISRVARTNGCDNVTVEQKAVGDTSSDSVTFTIEAEKANSHLGAIALSHARTQQVATTQVPLVDLSTYFCGKFRVPDVVKIDVEGAEVLVLEGMKAMLKAARPSVIVSTHSDDLKTECWSRLVAMGFEVKCLTGFTHELVAKASE